MGASGKNEHSRRQVLAGLACGTLAGVTGCCGVPVPGIEEGCQLERLFLTPPAPAASARLAFDTHAHFFNAHDVHVAGYLAHSVGHTAGEKLQELIKLIAPVIGRLTYIMTKSPAQELKVLCRLSESFAGAPQQEIDRFIDQEIDIHLRRLSELLFGELSGTRFEELYLEQANAVQPLGFDSSTAKLTQQEILLGLYSGSSNDPALTALQPFALQGRNPRNVFSFARFMLSHRYHNLRTFQKNFAVERNGVSVTACMGSLVDFTYWLGCPGEVSSFRDQIMLHEKLAILSGGFLLPLVPYNPWTDIEEDGASLKLVQMAVEQRGFVGVKIYPPMGYYAHGNASINVDTPFERPDKEALDDRLRCLYAYCSAAGVPVMAHSRRSMGRDKAHDEMASKVGWDAVDSLPEAQGLRVNLAHFGSEGDFDLSNDYARMVAEAEGVTFYGDLGYWSDLRTDANAQRILHDLLRTPISAREHLLDRIMYGSDWFMISMEDRWGTYFADFVDMLPTLSPEDTAFDRLFFLNAAKCFGLSKADGGGNRRRLEEFYEKNKIAAPAWMTYLDQRTSTS